MPTRIELQRGGHYVPVRRTNNLSTEQAREERRDVLALRAAKRAEYMQALPEIREERISGQEPRTARGEKVQSHSRHVRGRLDRMRPTRSIRRPKGDA